MPEKEQPPEEAIAEILKSIGGIISLALKESTEGQKEKYGFALLMFGVSGNEFCRMNYVANVNREDMLVALKEFIARAEGRYYDSREATIDFTKKKI